MKLLLKALKIPPHLEENAGREAILGWLPEKEYLKNNIQSLKLLWKLSISYSCQRLVKHHLYLFKEMTDPTFPVNY